MNKPFKFIYFILFTLCITLYTSSSYAQYHGAYPNRQAEKENDASSANQIKKIFSSQVTSVKQAEKLDKIYDDLYVSLWNYAVSDFNYQKRLYNLLDYKRFKVTRYTKEFTGDMENAMDNLNENYTNMLRDVKQANMKYRKIKKSMRTKDHKIIEELWSQKIEEYKKTATKFFKMQYIFLKTYHSLVAFIIEQGGSYYYNTKEQTIKFYKNGGYQYFGKSIDKLHKITFEQKKLLRANTPANIDPEIIK